MLGLRLDFGGEPDHLSIITSDYPGSGGPGRRRFLVVHDLVPGGTGYLGRLADPDRLRSILEGARTAIARCECQDEGRQACHRCLLAGVAPQEIGIVTRALALEVLDQLLKDWAFHAVASVAEIDISSVEQSELERRFAKRCTRLGSERVHRGHRPAEGAPRWQDRHRVDASRWGQAGVALAGERAEARRRRSSHAARLPVPTPGRPTARGGRVPRRLQVPRLARAQPTGRRRPEASGTARTGHHGVEPHVGRRRGVRPVTEPRRGSAPGRLAAADRDPADCRSATDVAGEAYPDFDARSAQYNGVRLLLEYLRYPDSPLAVARPRCGGVLGGGATGAVGATQRSTKPRR
ncbi:MAG: DUF1998 domain-containing protein [Ilumatobacteraceae bacterium]